MTKTVKTLLIIAAAVVVFGLVLSAVGLFVFGKIDESLEKHTETFASDVSAIYVDDTVADIKVYKTEGDEIVATYYDSEDKSYNLEVSGDTLYIKKSSSPWYKNISFFWNTSDYKVEIGVPESFSGKLTIKCDVGDADVNGLTLTDLDIDLSTGDIDTDSILCSGNYSVKTNTGDVTGSDITAVSVNAESDTGDIKLKRMTVTDSIYLETDTGDIRGSVTDSMENYSIRSDTDVGDNDLPGHTEGGRKTLKAETDTGDIEFEFNK